jgi:tetratricopeptide (TPR) repeat protein
MCLTQTLLAQGHNEQALEEIEKGISSPATSDADRARFEAWSATVHMALGDLGAAEEHAAKARAVGEAMGDDLTRSIAMGVLAAVRRFQGRFAEGLLLAEEAISLADRSPGREGHRFPLNLFRALLLFDLDRPEEAQAAIQEGRRLSEMLGVRAALISYHWLAALGHFLSGSWDDAIAECQASLEVGKETGMRQGLLFTYALTSIIALHRNDLGVAQDALASAEREFEGAGLQVGIDWMLWARGQVLEALEHLHRCGAGGRVPRPGSRRRRPGTSPRRRRSCR